MIYKSEWWARFGPQAVVYWSLSSNVKGKFPSHLSDENGHIVFSNSFNFIHSLTHQISPSFLINLFYLKKFYLSYFWLNHSVCRMCPLHWKHRVLTTGSPGMSRLLSFQHQLFARACARHWEHGSIKTKKLTFLWVVGQTNSSNMIDGL